MGNQALGAVGSVLRRLTGLRDESTKHQLKYSMKPPPALILGILYFCVALRTFVRRKRRKFT